MVMSPYEMFVYGTILYPNRETHDLNAFFYFPIYLQSVYIHSNTISKWCVGMRGRVDECSVAPLRDTRVKTLCGCREIRVQTKEKYKLRLQLKLTN
jgi:hypothetical protein